jgi:hypothetical protein
VQDYYGVLWGQQGGEVSSQIRVSKVVKVESIKQKNGYRFFGIYTLLFYIN